MTNDWLAHLVYHYQTTVPLQSACHTALPVGGRMDISVLLWNIIKLLKQWPSNLKVHESEHELAKWIEHSLGLIHYPIHLQMRRKPDSSFLFTN